MISSPNHLVAPQIKTLCGSNRTMKKTMNRSNLQFFGLVLVVAIMWLPISVWLMPRISPAPTWAERPSWYVSSCAMGILLAYALRWVANKAKCRGTTN